MHTCTQFTQGRTHLALLVKDDAKPVELLQDLLGRLVLLDAAFGVEQHLPLAYTRLCVWCMCMCVCDGSRAQTLMAEYQTMLDVLTDDSSLNFFSRPAASASAICASLIVMVNETVVSVWRSW